MQAHKYDLYKVGLIIISLGFLLGFGYSKPNYYLISSDSNNCYYQAKLHAVTGSDCLCMKISRYKNVVWHINWDEPSCFPVVEAHAKPQQPSPHVIPMHCNEAGDDCNQFQCLQLLYYDNTEHTAATAALHKKQCVDEERHALPLCDETGVCHSNG